MHILLEKPGFLGGGRVIQSPCKYAYRHTFQHQTGDLGCAVNAEPQSSNGHINSYLIPGNLFFPLKNVLYFFKNNKIPAPPTREKK